MNGCAVYDESGDAIDNSDWVSGSATLYFQPGPILCECALTSVNTNGDNTGAECAFIGITQRQPNGSDVPVPVAYANNVYDPNMSSLTFYVGCSESYMQYRVAIQYW